MKYITTLGYSLASLTLSSASPLSPRAPPANCKDIIFTVSATAVNRLALNPPPNFQDISVVAPFLLQPVVPNTVSGTQKIYGQYCEPIAKIPSRAKTLQLLISGNTYSHIYWNGFDGLPSPANPNSWAAFANEQGYATLAIDRLGIGRSDHPDPLNVVQAPYQVELYHDLIQQLRGSGPIKGIQKIIWVGHSYGSILGTQLSTNHPNDADVFIQTGLAIPLPNQNALPGELEDKYVPAATYDPTRFPPATYPPGYLVASSKEGRKSTFYSRPLIDFLPSRYDKDFQTEETITLGEALTQNLYNSTAYNKPVFVLTGQADAVFCGNGSRELGIPDCGSGPNSQLAALKAFYPAVPANKFATYTQPNAGHCNQIHYTAPAGFAKAHAFLAQQGF